MKKYLGKKTYYRLCAVALIVGGGLLVKFVESMSGGALITAGVGLWGMTMKELGATGEPLPKTDADITAVEKLGK